MKAVALFVLLLLAAGFALAAPSPSEVLVRVNSTTVHLIDLQHANWSVFNASCFTKDGIRGGHYSSLTWKLWNDSTGIPASLINFSRSL